MHNIFCAGIKVDSFNKIGDVIGLFMVYIFAFVYGYLIDLDALGSVAPKSCMRKAVWLSTTEVTKFQFNS